jgi:hypothetical protein
VPGSEPAGIDAATTVKKRVHITAYVSRKKTGREPVGLRVTC